MFGLFKNFKNGIKDSNVAIDVEHDFNTITRIINHLSRVCHKMNKEDVTDIVHFIAYYFKNAVNKISDNLGEGGQINMCEILIYDEKGTKNKFIMREYYLILSQAVYAISEKHGERQFAQTIIDAPRFVYIPVVDDKWIGEVVALLKKYGN